jgi:hypothetical protein
MQLSTEENAELQLKLAKTMASVNATAEALAALATVSNSLIRDMMSMQAMLNKLRKKGVIGD